MFAQQRALLSCSNIPQLAPQVPARRERGHRRDNARAPLEGGMGVECGGSGLDTNSSFLMAGRAPEGQRALPF